jgi:hypothetical protein
MFSLARQLHLRLRLRWRGRNQSSQRNQIIRHIAELPDHLGIAEIARSRVTSAAKCDRADVTLTRSPARPL